MFDPAKLDEALTLLGELLFERGYRFEVVAIGGGGLQLLGVIDRPTSDLDLVALLEGDKLIRVGIGLPSSLAEAVADVARVLNLPDDWVNGKPTALLDFGLPTGFVDRLERRAYGGLQLSLASRFDQIHLKLYAAADDIPAGKHHVDLRKLQPTPAELLAAAQWAKSHDASEGFAMLVADVLRDFGVEE